MGGTFSVIFTTFRKVEILTKSDMWGVSHPWRAHMRATKQSGTAKGRGTTLQEGTGDLGCIRACDARSNTSVANFRVSYIRVQPCAQAPQHGVRPTSTSGFGATGMREKMAPDLWGSGIWMASWRRFSARGAPKCPMGL